MLLASRSGEWLRKRGALHGLFHAPVAFTVDTTLEVYREVSDFAETNSSAVLNVAVDADRVVGSFVIETLGQLRLETLDLLLEVGTRDAGSCSFLSLANFGRFQLRHLFRSAKKHSRLYVSDSMTLTRPSRCSRAQSWLWDLGSLWTKLGHVTMSLRNLGNASRESDETC